MLKFSSLWLAIPFPLQHTRPFPRTPHVSLTHPIRAGAAAGSRSDVIELALRRELHAALTRRGGPSNTASPAAALRSLVDLSLGLLGEFPSCVDATLPLLLFEDAFDASPAASCDELWDVLEAVVNTPALSAALGGPFAKLRMPLLRIASSLLRRLSRTVHTVLLGRILTTLAAAFPLSDRSGVNLAGHFDGSNTTLYEGREEDAALLAACAEVGAAAPARTAPPVRARGPTPGPPPPTDGSAPTAVPNLDPATVGVLAVLPTTPAAAVHLREAVGAVAARQTASSRAFYRTFWRVQELFVRPAAATVSSDAWVFAVDSLRIVLWALERELNDAGAAAGGGQLPPPTPAPPMPPPNPTTRFRTASNF